MYGPKRILLVDDNRDEVDLALLALQRVSRNLVVATADNGQAALDMILNVQKRPDLVLLDLNLPMLSGLEVLRQARASGPARQLPIVMLTTSQDPRDEAHAVQAGCDGFFIKPLSFQESISLLRGVLDRWLADR